MMEKNKKFKDTYGKYIIAEFIIKEKKANISESINSEEIQVLEETENKLKIRFSHEETTIMKVMDKISEYCTIEDIHMKEAELEDILKRNI